ncbi:MAG: (2Fe-2S)-binding protein [Chlorobiaceae bacterium]|jgi:chlorosome envelope protein X|nr:(2Fe-2S)-binding protein [Chlorobiaceae bacterium]
MKNIINDRSCEAATGDRLIDVARKHHSHIGYFCGGNGICQTCYVKVLEGAELLSPLSEPEKAMLSDRLIKEGTRMACLATIERPGTIKIITAVEEVKQMFENTPHLLPAYSGKMGWESLVKLPETIALQIQRTLTGHFDILQILSDVVTGIGDALQLAIASFSGAGSQGNCSLTIPDSNTQKRLAEESIDNMLDGCCKKGAADIHAKPVCRNGSGIAA